MSDNTRRPLPDGRQADEGGRRIERQDEGIEPDYDPDQGRPLGEDDDQTIYRDGEPLTEVEAQQSRTPPLDGPGVPGQESEPANPPDELWGDPLEQSSQR